MFRRTICYLAVVVLLLAFASALFAQATADNPEPQVIQLGAQLACPDFMAVDDYGHMYVLDGGRQEVLCFNSNGELEQSWRDEVIHDSSCTQGRRGIQILKDGSIFLAAAYQSKNLRIIGPGKDVDGPVVPADQSIAGLLGPDGYYYTFPWDQRNDNRLFIYSFDGKLQSTWEDRNIWSMSMGPDGLLYAMKLDEAIVMVMDLTGKVKREIDLTAIYGKEKCEGRYGHAISVDTNGDLYICDGGAYVRTDANGKLLAKWECQRDLKAWSCYSSNTVPVIKNGLLYVLHSFKPWAMQDEKDAYKSDPDMAKRRWHIEVFTPDGKCVAHYVSKSETYNLPSHIAVQSDGSYALSQIGFDITCVFDAAGKTLGPVPGFMRSDSIAASPNGGFYEVVPYIGLSQVDYDAKPIKKFIGVGSKENEMQDNEAIGHIAVDPSNGQIWTIGGGGSMEVFNPDGKMIKSFPENRKLNFWTLAVGAAIDHKGIYYLSDAVGHRVVKVDSNGNMIGEIGKKGSGLGELLYPEGLMIDSEDRLYVADSGNSRIQVFDADGTPLGFWGHRGKGDGELDRAYGIAMGPNATIWIADTFNNRIVKVPMAKFWDEIYKDFKPEPAQVMAKREAVPEAGDVMLTGIVVAGTDDFTDTVYIESPDRAWGSRVTLPKNGKAMRGEKCKMSGKLELKARTTRHLVAEQVEKLESDGKTPGPVGMANLYVGDGYRNGNMPQDLSNLGLLIRCWGRVTSVDENKGIFVINDGSYSDDKGLTIYANNLQHPLAEWPEEADYVCVTGISTVVVEADGSLKPGVRLRNQDDVQLL